MKKWVRSFFFVFNVTMIATTTTLLILSPLWAFIPVLLDALFNLLSFFLPNYSTKKAFKFIYEQSFVGDYKADLQYQTYINSKKNLIQGTHPIKFSLEINNEGKIIKKQSTIDNSDSTSKSESYIISSSKEKINIVLKFLQEANYPDNSDRIHDGYEIIEFDKTKKTITKSIYFTKKPSSGKIINIKKIS